MKVLETDHYGLEKVKERVLEFLAVRMLTKKRGKVPSSVWWGRRTGKTSSRNPLPRAMNKKICAHQPGRRADEAETGAQAHICVSHAGKDCEWNEGGGVKNPLMLLDEIEVRPAVIIRAIRLCSLEVLDAEQNVKVRG